MKIIFNVSAMQSGGAERVVSLLSAELAKRGHDVTILMVSTNQNDSFYKVDSNVSLVPLLNKETISSRFFERVKLIRQYCLSVSPDVVIAFLPHVCIYTFYALKKTGIPIILSERNDPNQYSPLYKMLLKSAFAKSDGCVFQTHDCLKWYRRRGQKASDRIIFNPVNLPFVPPAYLGAERKKSVLFVGRLDKQKNYDLGLRAFACFRKAHSDFSFDVYGDGPEKKNFFDLAHKLGLMDCLRYHGSAPDWQEREYNAALFISPSLFEGMPNSLLEAAALNIPCVATDCPIGGSKELSRLFDNIYLVNNKCSERLFCAKMEEALLLSKPKTVINNRLSLSFIVDQWIGLIESVVKNQEKA